MKKSFIFLTLLMMVMPLWGFTWKAQWIEAQDNRDQVNTWQVFRKTVNLKHRPDSLIARIAVDSKYWMWINGECVVFEGGLKRGPAPHATYYDRLDIAPYLQKGRNTIALLTCFFGKHGFSHMNSGRAGLLFDAQGDGTEILSDATWQAMVHPAYGSYIKPAPNVRLPESSISYDGRKDLGSWQDPSWTGVMPYASEMGMKAVNEVYGQLVERPIPFFVFSGLTEYVKVEHDTARHILRCRLPYNAQVTPYIKIKANAGLSITIRTDCFDKSGEPSVMARYITREGEQSFEGLGWMNGNWVEYTIPEGVEVLDVRYRESGYDTRIAGSFTCNDPFWNELWKRSARTLYLNMRDTYFDCPDRERAQWWGDIVNDIQENFYVLSPSSWQLVYKGMYELMNWQKPDGVIYSPVPAGNWDKELPVQMLMSLGMYGFYTQYYNSGDDHFIAPLYDRIHKYLHEVWQPEEDGFVDVRQGGWSWADWGTNIDMELLTNAWYFLALSAERQFADILGREGDEADILAIMDKMMKNFDRKYWTGTAYRSPNYQGQDDDRAQALAVVAGLAGEEKYPHLLRIFQKNRFASPLLELYVQTAMFKMGQGEEALKRAREQYSDMMSYQDETTVFEFWQHKGVGGTNHAWASGMTVVMGREVCGIRPTSLGFQTFEVAPQLAGLEWVETSLETRYGKIQLALRLQANGNLKVDIVVPHGTQADVKWKGRSVKVKSGRHSLIMKG